MGPLFKLSPDNTLRMVQEYKKHELLYNKSHKLYKDTAARRVALKSIGDVLQLNKSVNEINRKLKSLRSTFILEQNKILEDKEYIPKLIWYNEMASFIPFSPAGKSVSINVQSIGGRLPPRHDATPRRLKRLNVSHRSKTHHNPAMRMVKPPISVLLASASAGKAPLHQAASRHKVVPFKKTGLQTIRKENTSVDAQSCDELSLGSVEVPATSEVEKIGSQTNKKTTRSIKTRTQAERREKLGLGSIGVQKPTAVKKMVSQTNKKRKTPIGIQLEVPNEAELGSVVALSSDEEDLEVSINAASNKKRLRSKENGVSASCGTSTSLAIEKNQSQSSSNYRATANELDPESQEQSQTNETLHEDDILIAFGKFINLSLRKLDMDSFLDTKTLIQKMLKDYRAYFLQEMSDSDNDATDDSGQPKPTNRSLLQQVANTKPKVSFKTLVNNDDEYDAFTYEIVHQLRMIPGHLYFHAQSRIVTQIVAGRLPMRSSDEEESASEDEGTLKKRSLSQEQSNPSKKVILDEDRNTLDERRLPKILSVERINPQEQSNSPEKVILDEDCTTLGETPLPEILAVERIIPQEREILDEKWTILGKQLFQEVSSRERIIHQEQGIVGEEGTILGEQNFQEVSSRERIIHQEQTYPQELEILGEEGTILGKQNFQEVSSQVRIIHQEQTYPQELEILGDEGKILGKSLVQELPSQERIIHQEHRTLGEESTPPSDALTGQLSNMIGSSNIDTEAAVQDLLNDVTSPSKQLFRDLDTLDMEI